MALPPGRNVGLPRLPNQPAAHPGDSSGARRASPTGVRGSAGYGGSVGKGFPVRYDRPAPDSLSRMTRRTAASSAGESASDVPPMPPPIGGWHGSFFSFSRAASRPTSLSGGTPIRAVRAAHEALAEEAVGRRRPLTPPAPRS